MKTERVWTDTICHRHLTPPNSWLFRNGCFSRPLIFKAISNSKSSSRLLLNCGTGQKSFSTRECLRLIRRRQWNIRSGRDPIFLPNHRGKFFAVLAGEAESYLFSSATDRFELKPSARHPIFQQLIESNFAGSVWSLRSSSRHAKSKTYKKDFE